MIRLRAFAVAWRQRFAGLPRNRAGLAAVVSVIAALTPIIVAAVRTAIHRWVPIGDDGLLLLRSADVGTSNHPWLGTWTSASLTAGKDFNNPGPLMFDILALPVKVLGYGIGMPIGLAAMNGSAVVGAALVARRQAGSRAVVPMMVAAAAIAWTMGSELLIDPWQPHAMMLPFFFLIALLWGIVCGDLALIGWFAAVSSLLVQTHVSYSFLVLFFTVGVAAAVLFHVRRAPQNKAGLRRIGITTVATALVLWSQPLIEQFFGNGEGNLSRLLSSSSTDQPKIGLRLGTRLIANVVVLPPWFSRGSFDDAVPPTPYTGTSDNRQLLVHGLTSFRVAAPALLAFIAVAGVLLWRAVRARQRAVASALAMVEGLVGSALMAMYVTPIGIIGLSPHQLRWLWPMAAFSLVAIVTAAVVVARLEFANRAGRASAEHAAARFRRIDRAVVTAGVAVVVGFAAAGCPTYYQLAGPTVDHNARGSIVAMMNQMTILEGSGPLIFDDTGLRFAEPYSGAMMARLGEMGVAFEVAPPGLVRQVGDGRKISGRATGRLYLREGQDAVDVPAGVDRVAFVAGLTDRELAERDALTERWTRRLTDGFVALDAAGEAALGSGTLGMSQAQVDGLDDPRAVVDFGLLANAAAHGWLDLTGGEVAELARLQDLQTRWRFLTVGLFLAPVSP